jgi:predicted Zn-dependent protease
MRDRERGSIVLGMSWDRLRAATAALAWAALAAACRTAPTPPATAQHNQDTTADTVVAEIALEKGDCRAAADAYANASSHGTAALARRASEVALNCENMPAAWESAKHWRALAPDDRKASIVYATVALRLYKIEDARTALTPLVKASGPTADKDLVALVNLLTQLTDPPAANQALDDTLDAHASSPPVLSAFGAMALQSYDFNLAERRAHEALDRDAASPEALRLLARVRVLRGDAPGAIAAAHQVMSADPTGGAFELSEVLMDLDRLEESRQELERLRASHVDPAEIDRRLALLAFDSGDMAEAQRRFSDLVSRGEASDAALFYLADIAARTGDKDTALAAFRQLGDSSMGLAARTRAAGLLLEHQTPEDRTAALQLLDGYATEHPESTFELTVAKAHLLADHGDPDGGLALLSSALERYPHNPTLGYERATLLERAGRVHESVQAFERLLAERPEDPNLQNALGYTLADHGLELPRAEGLIRRALGVMPDNPEVLDSLGWVRLRRGDPRGAAPMLERAYAIGRDPEIAAHWGEALWLSGSQPQARQVWAAALARHPDSEELKATLHRLLPPEHP